MPIIKNLQAITTVHLSTGDVTTPVIWYHDNITLPPAPKVTTLKQGKHPNGYYNIYCGFDIETTNIKDAEPKQAYMYIWQMSISTATDAVVVLGRTWGEFVELIDKIADFYNVSRETKIIIWIANFSFEFQFMRKWFNWDNEEYSFFAKEERKPLLATYRCIEFRECLTISGGSLAQLAKNYTITQKLKGDLDYSIIRHNETPLTDAEINYCINDVVILSEYSEFIFNNFIKPNKKVPLTKTGLLRQEVKVECRKMCKDLKAYKAQVMQAFPNETTYKMWFSYLFRGGFVHSNFTLTNQIHNNVQCYDITSSYPARMNLSYYPVTPFKRVKFDRSYLKTHCCIMLVEFWSIKNTTFHSIESEHKIIESVGLKLDNGRMYQADYIKVMLTELDYQNYCKFYKWEKAKVNTFDVAERGNLPRFILNILNKHYIHKANLKSQGLSDTTEYSIAKSGVNSAYGLMVTRLALDKVDYKNNEWCLSDVTLNFKDEKEKQILLPQWGIYVSAHARHELLTMVYEITKACGNIVIYCDTDSIKCLPHKDIESIISAYNADIARQLTSKGLNNPAFSDLGMFDNEYKHEIVTRFKTLGAKRYLTEVKPKDDKSKYKDITLKATIAGLPKNTLKKMQIDAFKMFDVNGMFIKAELSDKLTTYYNDDEHERLICDGRTTVLMTEKSSVCLYEIPFTMCTDIDYYNMLVNNSIFRRKLQ